MANEVVTLLKAAGAKLEAFLNKVIPEGETVAKDVEPIVDMAFPGIAALFNSTVAAVGLAEAAGTNGAAKLAAVLPIVSSASGLSSASQAQVTTWINAIVTALNALAPPATATAAATATASTPAASTESVVTVS